MSLHPDRQSAGEGGGGSASRLTDVPRPSSGVFAGREHLLGVRVYYEDTDFTGVVYHAGYLRFFERGRSEFLRLASPADPEASPIFAVVRMEIDFRAPARIHDELLVRTAYRGSRGPRLDFMQRVERDGRLLCEAQVTAAAIHPDGRPRKPGRAELDAWEAWRSHD